MIFPIAASLISIFFAIPTHLSLKFDINTKSEPFLFLHQVNPKDPFYCERVAILSDLAEKNPSIVENRSNIFESIVLLSDKSVKQKFEDLEKVPAQLLIRYQLIIRSFGKDQNLITPAYLRLLKCLEDKFRQGSEVSRFLNNKEIKTRRKQLLTIMNLKLDFISNENKQTDELDYETLDPLIKEFLIKLLGSEALLRYKVLPHVKIDLPRISSNNKSLQTENQSEDGSLFLKSSQELMSDNSMSATLPPKNFTDKIYFQIFTRSFWNANTIPLYTYIIGNISRSKKRGIARCKYYMRLMQYPFKYLLNKKDDIGEDISNDDFANRFEEEINEEYYKKVVDSFMSIPPSLDDVYLDIVSCLNDFKELSKELDKLMSRIIVEGLFNDIIDTRQRDDMIKKASEYNDTHYLEGTNSINFGIF